MPGIVLSIGHTVGDKTDKSLPLQIWTLTGYLSILRNYCYLFRHDNGMWLYFKRSSYLLEIYPEISMYEFT